MPYVTQDDIHVLVSLYHKYGGNAAEAARNCFWSAPTLIRYWKKQGLEINSRGDRGDGRHTTELSDDEKKTIVSLYSKYNGNSAEAARNCPWSPPTVAKYWKREGLPPLGGKRVRERLEKRVL